MLMVKNKFTVAHIGFKYFNRLQNKLNNQDNYQEEEKSSWTNCILAMICIKN